MQVGTAVVLGLVQGVTEFLPISSTAHVTLVGILFGLKPQAVAQQWTAFLASIQLGSLAALVWYFRRSLLQMGRELRKPDSGGRRLGGALLLGSLPIAIAGVGLKPLVEGPLTKEPLAIAAALVAVSALMAWAEVRGGRQRELAQLSWRDALVVGIGQVLALLPGSSRSGSTLAAAMLVGLTRRDAAQFAFLLGIPAIAGSGVLELRELLRQPLLLGSWEALGMSFAASCLSSYLAIAFLLRYLRGHTLWGFIVYRLMLAVVLGISAGVVNG